MGFLKSCCHRNKHISFVFEFTDEDFDVLFCCEKDLRRVWIEKPKTVVKDLQAKLQQVISYDSYAIPDQ